MSSVKKVELLAPAGNYECFLAAINAGADAVYLGGTKFGARAYADNFSEEELLMALRYAHIFGKKIYLVLNILMKDQEMDEVYAYITPYYRAGLDGVIVQDMGLFFFLKEKFPLLELHVSTQMTITGVAGAQFMKEQGAVRVVPARELSLAEIKKIKEATGLELETFIHGAMCYCYSGQCLFSSLLGGRSGNRGKCAQPCRLPYRISSESGTTKEEYPLSLKDMCVIDHIKELIEAGIDSFKVEGRMKKAEYVAGVISIYRKYIDFYYAQPDKPLKVSPTDMDMLRSLYIRTEIQDGYYFKHNGKEMITLTSPAYGKSEEEILARLRTAYIDKNRKLKLQLKASFLCGRPATLSLSMGENQVTMEGVVVTEAMKQPLTRENLENGLSRLGNTAFEIQSMNIEMEDHIFYSLKMVNELRREAVEALENQILQSNYPDMINREEVYSDGVRKERTKEQKKESIKSLGSVHVLISGKEQLDAIMKHFPSITRLYVDCDCFDEPQDGSFFIDDFHVQKGKGTIPMNCEIFVVLPAIVRDRDQKFLFAYEQVLKEADGCLVKNIESYHYLQNIRYQGKVALDASIYQWNQETISFWENKADSICVPYELNAKEKKHLFHRELSCELEQVVYGRIPMMITANCIAKTKGGCPAKTSMHYFLQDRYQKNFPVQINCRHCYNVIYNSVPLSLHDCIENIRQENRHIRIDFTIESPEEMNLVLVFIGKGKKIGNLPYSDYTTGHEKRGVE